MAKIAGIYANGFGAPVAGIELILTARATSAGVIMTTTAAQTTGADGSYGFDVLAGVYVVTANGAYLGVITVGTDSPDGTLNDYLAGYDPSALTPEIVQTVEELVKEAQEAAAAAAGSATTADEKATAAAGSAAAAEDAAERAEAAGGTDTSKLAKLDAVNVFTKRQDFNEGIAVKTTGSMSTFDKVKITASFSSTVYSEFEGDVLFAYRTHIGSIKSYCPLSMMNNQRIKLYSSGERSFSGIEFYRSELSGVQGAIYPNTYKSRLELWHETLPGLGINLPNAEPDGLKFIGNDGVEQAIYHSGYLPPAASVAAELPTGGVRQPQFFFDEAAGQLYFLYEAKKYAVTLTPA
ncbi:prophage tail fiber N-terminal domain-containing protein [Salmonella enterica]|nr:prophage tail fiber N-terminal domain-containing protein [Salmonella enterica]EJX2428136.1 prophage tail fiber N-terminal domain-containing protein [Salmonella enterica]EJX3548557.1 prophage tail fiber N-terminal domain-containing protein [Salmonella enterica]